MILSLSGASLRAVGSQAPAPLHVFYMGLAEIFMKQTRPDAPIERGADQLLDQNEVAQLLGVSPRALESMRFHRRGPSYVHVGCRVRYRRAAIEAYLESRTVATRDQGAPNSASA